MAYIGPVVGKNEDSTIEEAVRVCADWFEADREAKQFYMDEMEEMYKLYKGDHWDLTGPNGKPLRTEQQKQKRPNPVENYTFALIEGLVAEFSQDVDIVDFPVEEGDEDVAEVYTDLKRFIAYKNGIKWEREKWLRWFFLYGTGIWHVYWDPNWMGGKGPNRWVGDIRWKALHPAVLYPDARCRENIEEGRRVHKAYYVTKEALDEMFPEAAQKVQADMIDESMLIGDYEESFEDLSEGLVLLVETWYKGRPMILADDEQDMGPGLHVIWWAGDGQFVYLKHANYVYFDPGETTKFPFIVKQCYPRENSIWGFGEAYFLKNPQIILNKTAEMILEGHMHHAIGQTFYHKGALTKLQEKQIREYGQMPGMWFDVEDLNGIRREFGQGVPPSLQGEVERLQKVMENIVGRFDISQGKTPGSVTAFRALDLLAARAQVRLRSKEQAMTSAYEEVGVYMNNLINLFYTETRAYRILGQDETERPRYGYFSADDFKRVFVYDTAETIPLNEFQPEEGMVEGEDYEIYSPEFDTEARVSTTLPTDRLFYMDMAKELFAAQLIDAEVFWYVMANGKFPPFEELMKKEQERKAMEEMMAMAGQPMPPGQLPSGEQEPQDLPVSPESNGQMTEPADLPEVGANDGEQALDNLEAALQNRPDLLEQLLALSPEEREQVLNRVYESLGGR
ncbi:hypothetical protein BSNK01_11970 [Bacillaceae bacterium]